ncbi:MAG TPA: hypothetical protein VGS10_23660 [Terracidiphilus sp.]|nr:hypothetical protein [Terracidiphilus sp.]
MFPERPKAPGRKAILALAFLAVLAPGQVRASPQPPSKKAVHAEGCVQSGVEAHCLVLRDIKTGHLYDLIFKAERPPVGLGIEFIGVLHAGPTTCMQGTAVEVTSWAHRPSIRCVPGQAGKRDRPEGR